jgi:hypothetical protein
MKNYPQFPFDKLTQDRLKRLREITADCRPDMHEPDEQGVSVVMHGNHLDNAMGDSLTTPEFQEYVVEIKNDVTKKSKLFNLASLIALARRDCVEVEETTMSTESAAEINVDIAQIIDIVHNNTTFVSLERSEGEIPRFGLGINDYSEVAKAIRKKLTKKRKK